jgi:hypothetical protein
MHIFAALQTGITPKPSKDCLPSKNLTRLLKQTVNFEYDYQRQRHISKFNRRSSSNAEKIWKYNAKKSSESWKRNDKRAQRINYEGHSKNT